METNYTLYMHVCPNSKVYVGITSKAPAERFRNGHGYDKNPLFSKAIEKYGWENIEHEILLEGLTKSEAAHYEQKFIEMLGSNIPENGYNISSGGEFGFEGRHNTPESRVKAWETRRKNKTDVAWNKGLHLEGKKIGQYTLDGILIANYISSKYAEEITSIKSSHINECCNGKRKTAGGYKWRFE